MQYHACVIAFSKLPWQFRLAALNIDFLALVAKSQRWCVIVQDHAGLIWGYGIHCIHIGRYIDCNRPCICLIRKYSHRYIRMWYVCASIDDTPLIVVFANAFLQERCIQILTYMSWIICSITMITRYYMILLALLSICLLLQVLPLPTNTVLDQTTSQPYGAAGVGCAHLRSRKKPWLWHHDVVRSRPRQSYMGLIENRWPQFPWIMAYYCNPIKAESI